MAAAASSTSRSTNALKTKKMDRGTQLYERARDATPRAKARGFAAKLRSSPLPVLLGDPGSRCLANALPTSFCRHTPGEKLRLGGTEFGPRFVRLDVSTHGLRSHAFAYASDEVARTPHRATVEVFTKVREPLNQVAGAQTLELPHC